MNMKFAVIIHLYGRENEFSCGLQSGVPQDKPLFGYLKKPDIPFWTSKVYRGGRCAYCLKDNLYVSASSRLGRESGNLVKIVDVTIGPQECWVDGISVQV
jgi:hypothetical protein